MFFFYILQGREKMFDKYNSFNKTEKPAKPDKTGKGAWVGETVIFAGFLIIIISIFTLQGFVESIVISAGLLIMFIGFLGVLFAYIIK